MPVAPRTATRILLPISFFPPVGRESYHERAANSRAKPSHRASSTRRRPEREAAAARAATLVRSHQLSPRTGGGGALGARRPRRARHHADGRGQVALLSASG